MRPWVADGIIGVKLFVKESERRAGTCSLPEHGAFQHSLFRRYWANYAAKSRGLAAIRINGLIQSRAEKKWMQEKRMKKKRIANQCMDIYTVGF